MDQETALKLFYNASILIFLDAPKNLHFGVDYKSWQIGPKFKGVKFIPPGLHFIYYGSVNTFGDYGARTGFFKYFEEKEIIVKQWNPDTEDLYDEVDQDQVDRIKYNIKELDQFLGPYPLVPQDKESLNVYHRWIALTSKISSRIVKMILPKNGKISAISSVSRFSDITNPSDESKSTPDQQQPMEGSTTLDSEDQTMATDNSTPPPPTTTATPLSTSKGKTEEAEDTEKYRLNFTPIELKRSFPKSATAEEITKYSIDKSYQLNFILEHYYKGDTNLFLGEFQLSYIIFLIGQVYDGFEQWKTMIVMMLQCKEALEQYGETLFKEFLEILNDQLKDFPHDFFYDILSGSNFLRSTIKVFYRIIQEVNGQYPGLEEQLTILLDKLNKTFKWDLRSECYEIDKTNALALKDKINQQQQHFKPDDQGLSTQNNNKEHNKMEEDKLQKAQLVKLMEELGIENEEDMPVIVDYDE